MTAEQLAAMRWAYADIARELQWTSWPEEKQHSAELGLKHMQVMADALDTDDVWRLMHENQAGEPHGWTLAR